MWYSAAFQYQYTVMKTCWELKSNRITLQYCQNLVTTKGGKCATVRKQTNNFHLQHGMETEYINLGYILAWPSCYALWFWIQVSRTRQVHPVELNGVCKLWLSWSCSWKHIYKTDTEGTMKCVSGNILCEEGITEFIFGLKFGYCLAVQINQLGSDGTENWTRLEKPTTNHSS